MDTAKRNKEDGYSIRKILEKEFDRFWQNRSLPNHVLRAVRGMLNCRTQVYGGHMFGCPDEHFSLVLFNSCKKRNCPTCQNSEIEYWCRVQKERILKTGHYHLVFKQPELMNAGFLSNYKEYATLIFDSARDALKELLPDDVKAGFIFLLHTHGHNNEIHPHVHCALTDGGMNKNGEYERFDSKLLTTEKIQELYQKHYLRKLRRRIKNGEIEHDKSPVELSRAIVQKGMSVFVSDRYDRGEWLISYFGRNSRGGSIRDNQIVYVDDEKIRYNYRNRKKQIVETEMNLHTFIQRFLYNIPPDRFNTIRYYGLYSPGSVEDCQKVRRYLNQKPYKKPSRISLLEDDGMKCPSCGKKLVHQESFERNTIPYLLMKKLKFDPAAMSKNYWQVPSAIFGLKFLWSEYSPVRPIRSANRIA